MSTVPQYGGHGALQQPPLFLLRLSHKVGEGPGPEAWPGQVLTLPFHASGQALLIATVLTAIPLALVHCTVLVITTRVGQVLPNGALEETLAALAAINPIVLAYERQVWQLRTFYGNRPPCYQVSCQSTQRGNKV